METISNKTPSVASICVMEFMLANSLLVFLAVLFGVIFGLFRSLKCYLEGKEN